MVLFMIEHVDLHNVYIRKNIVDIKISLRQYKLIIIT